MADQPTEIEQKMIEFATKTAQTIQNQAGQIQALSHVLLIALTAVSEQNESFKHDFINRIGMVRDQLSDRPVDKFTNEYFEELVRFLEDPYLYSKAQEHNDKPGWFKGIITGGKPSAEDNKE
jgi:hypothetical protein